MTEVMTRLVGCGAGVSEKHTPWTSPATACARLWISLTNLDEVESEVTTSVNVCCAVYIMSQKHFLFKLPLSRARIIRGIPL